MTAELTAVQQREQSMDGRDVEMAQLERIKLYFNQAVQLSAGGEYRAAIELYRQCLGFMPGLRDARFNLAWCLGCLEDFEAAGQELELLLAECPEHTPARIMSGTAYLKRGMAADALEQFRIADQAHPGDVIIVRNIADALYHLQRYDEAREHVEQVLSNDPGDYIAQTILASIERTEHPQRSLALYRQLMERNAADHRIRTFHATLLLSLGDFEQGWREFEQRIPTLQMSDDILALPRWHGQPLAGKSIVLVAEQGHGDALQFIRYARVVSALGARVMVLCHNDQIRPLLATVAGVDCAVIPQERLPFLPDYHCPLMSLPFELGTTVETIPPSNYIHPDLHKKEQWQRRLQGHPGLKVGIVWAGNRAQADNSKRSLSFDRMLGLLDMEGVTFISLQVGPDALKHQHSIPSSDALVDWTDELNDFRDTAALVSCLDLVISICSSVTHLSGAMGVPTWVMLQYDADWRWLRDREDSPWYPSVRLFRQARPGEWAPVLQQIRESLQVMSHCSSRSGNDCRELAPPRQLSPAAGELYQRGVMFFNAGDLHGAEACFRKSLAEDDRLSDSLNGLATVLDLRGESLDAAELYRRALEISPQDPLVLFNLANTLRKCSRAGEAEGLYLRALQANPAMHQAWAGLGNILIQESRLDEAEAALDRCLSLYGAHADALCDRGVIELQRDQHEAAEKWFRRAFEADSGHAAALNQLGMLLMRCNRLEEAEQFLRRACEVKPDYWLALNNLGVLLHWAGRLDEAEACHRRFVAAQPENGTPHYNLALVLLSQEKYGEGWKEYEWRFDKENPVPKRHEGLPRWKGEDLHGRSILVHAEQGYGDTIQFIRYLPLLAARGATVVLECQDRVICPLFENLPSVAGVITQDEPECGADFQIPLMSLPFALGEQAWHEPAAVKYLSPDPALCAEWRQRVAPLSGLRVGIVWAGRAGHGNNHNRTIPPADFALLAGVTGVSYVNLLVGVNDPLADKALSGLEMFDPRSGMRTFADTAALLFNLDLLITVDTATAHLAGALGKPAWILLPHNPDWRWSHGSSTTPLYPSAKLYRQQRPSAWQEVIEAVRRDLVKLVAAKSLSIEGLLELARSQRDSFGWQGALDTYCRVLELQDDSREALLGVGACLQMLNRCTEAISWYDKMILLAPDEPVVHCNRALACLTDGRYAEGWQELQWRKRMISEKLPPIPFLTPQQVASGIAGTTILLHSEQGFGDTIHLIRYAVLLAECGARVVASVQPQLARLVSCVSGISQVVPHGELLPAADFQALMMDLPWLFDTSLEDVPASTPYVTAPHDLLSVWGTRLDHTPTQKVGLVWACGGENRLNRELRSLPFELVATFIAQRPEIQFYSLQVGPAALAPSEYERHGNLHDLTGQIRDFSDTAALITQLDHVVTIDSAVAHLAGALGKPTSLLLPHFREWRWLERNGYAVWYPTVQVFSQIDQGEWGETLQRVAGVFKNCRAASENREGTQKQRECRLCGTDATLLESLERPFFICTNCGLIFSDNLLS